MIEGEEGEEEAGGRRQEENSILEMVGAMENVITVMAVAI